MEFNPTSDWEKKCLKLLFNRTENQSAYYDSCSMTKYEAVSHFGWMLFVDDIEELDFI